MASVCSILVGSILVVWRVVLAEVVRAGCNHASRFGGTRRDGDSQDNR
jgi:hypothetical protein